MNICISVINVIQVIVKTVILVIREIVETVCKWVTTVITTIKEVVQKVCKWLPWPLNKLCNWVTKLIEVVEVVTKWVCEEVITRIFDWVEVIFIYLFYFLTWVCWVINWPLRFFLDLIWCWMGIRPKKFIHVCVKILTDEKDDPALSVDKVKILLSETQKRFEQCNISLCILGIQLIKKPNLLTGYECGVSGLFSKYHVWFANHQCSNYIGSSIVPITIFVVKNLNPGKGCAIPGNHYIVIDVDASNATIAHEIGHLSDLWKHSDDPGNVMYSPTSDDSVKFTKSQCCMIRSSRYATLINIFGCSKKEAGVASTTSKSRPCCE